MLVYDALNIATPLSPVVRDNVFPTPAIVISKPWIGVDPFISVISTLSTKKLDVTILYELCEEVTLSVNVCGCNSSFGSETYISTTSLILNVSVAVE